MNSVLSTPIEQARWLLVADGHHAWVGEMGWHTSTPLEAAGLIASEVAEVADALLDGPERRADLAEELADVLLRCFDLAYRHGLPLPPMTPAARHHQGLLPLTRALGPLLNACRGAQPDATFAAALYAVIEETLRVGDMHRFDLLAACEAKCAKNRLRGSRGRAK